MGVPHVELSMLLLPPVIIDEVQPIEEPSPIQQEVAPVEEPAPAPTGEAPEFITKPTACKTVSGETVTFACEVIGEPTPEVMWYFKGNELKTSERYVVTSKQEVQSLEITQIVLSDAGVYDVIARNCFGEVRATTTLGVEKKKEGAAPEFVEVYQETVRQSFDCL